MNITVRRMAESDISPAANVHKIAFPRQTFSRDWIECSFRSFPMSQCFVAELDGKIVAFAIWTEKSGFRQEAFVELAQVAVLPEAQGKGICTKLIQESLNMVANKIKERGATLKNIIVNTREDNASAMHIYKKVLGAQEVARVPGVFSADEIYLIARDADRLVMSR